MSAVKEKKETKTLLGQGNLILQLQHPTSVNGYDACSVSDCNYRAFEGSSSNCSNCGHNYDKDWST